MTNSWCELILYVEYENYPDLELYLLEHGYTSYELIDPRTELDQEDLESWLYFDKEIFKDAYDGITIKLYDQDDDFEDLIAYIEKEDLFTYEKNLIDDTDWANNWKDFHHTREIGQKLVIKPQWEDYENPGDKLVMDLSPGMAFGTGEHESTELALVNLEKYINPGDRILDIGTGSGILAIAAKLLGAGYTVGTDLDEKTLEISRANARDNQVDIDFYQSNLLDQVQGIYDIVIANIVVEIIEKMLNDLANVLDKDGYFIVSGILKSKEDKLYDLFECYNLETVESIGKNEWVSIVARFKNV